LPGYAGQGLDKPYSSAGSKDLNDYLVELKNSGSLAKLCAEYADIDVCRWDRELEGKRSGKSKDEFSCLL